MAPRKLFHVAPTPRRARDNKADLCATCKRNRRAVRARRRQCWKCISRARAIKDPVSYCFYNLRKSAKRRGHEFTITKAYFRRWAIRYDYLTLRGRGREGYVVDRKNDNLGYVPGNLQCITGSENTRKENERRAAAKVLSRKQIYVDAKIHNYELTHEDRKQLRAMDREDGQ